MQMITTLWLVPSYTAWWQKHIGVTNLPKVVTQRCPELDLNPRPTDRKSNALPVTLPRHLNTITQRDWDVFSEVHRQFALPSNRHHWSNGDCLEGKRENYQVCSVQYDVQQLCTEQCTHMSTDLTVLWIEFYLNGPISLWIHFCVCMYLLYDCILRACVVL